MSIVTDALNRLQAERSRLSSKPESATGSERPASPESLKPNYFSSQPPSRTIRNILRVSLIIVALGAVGIGAYLWGLTLTPDVAKVSPEHDTGPVTWDEVSPAEAPSQSADAVSGETGQDESSADPVTMAEAEDTLESPSAKAASETGVESASVPEESLAASSKPTAPATVSAAPVSEDPGGSRKQDQPTEQVQEPRKEPMKVASVVPSEHAQASPPPAASDVQLEESGESTETTKTTKTRVPPIPRYASPIDAKLIQAQYLIKKRRYRQAIIVLQPLFVRPPDAWEPWFWLGTAKLGLGEYDEAEESFIEGLARNAAVPQLWVQRALVNQQQGEMGEAIESLRQAELIAPELPEVQLNLAYSLEIQGNIPLAVDHYQTFLALTEGEKVYQPARKKVLKRIIRLEAA